MFGNLIKLRDVFRQGKPAQADIKRDLSIADCPHAGAVDPSNVRALATGAAIATSLDGSPAVVVEIYEYAHRYRDRPKRSA